MLPAWQIISILVFFGAIVGLAYYLATRGSVEATMVAGGTAPSSLKVSGMSLAIDTPGSNACLPDDMIKDSLTAARPVVRMTDESTRLMMELLGGKVAYNMFTLEPPRTGDIAGYWMSKKIGSAGAAAVARTLGLASTAASGNQFVVYMEFPSTFSVETHGADEFLADKAFFFAGTSRSLKPSTVRSQWAKRCNPPMPDITVRCKAAYSSCVYVGDGSVSASVSADETLQQMSSCAPSFLASRLLLWLPEQSDVASYAACYASTQSPVMTQAATTTTRAATTTTQAATNTTRAATNTTRAATNTARAATNTTQAATNTTQAATTTTRAATTTTRAATNTTRAATNTTRAATNTTQAGCIGISTTIKGPCYINNEQSGPNGAHTCTTDMDCSGLRTCSYAGWCGEGPDYTRAADGTGGGCIVM